MPLPLDTLLFWIGLVITFVGLYVFITGRSSSDPSKKGSNRFEAFGIKIDVSNPSLLLIILGVVMMMAPKFIPQPQELGGSGTSTVVSGIVQKTEKKQAKTVAGSEQVPPAPEPKVQPPAPQVEQVPPPRTDTVTAEKVPVENKESTPEKPAHTRISTGENLNQAKAPAKAATQNTTASASRPPVPRLKKTLPAKEPAKPAAKPLLLVFVRAETSQKAGMTSDTIKSYTKKLGDELARQADIVFSGDLDVRHETAKGMDSALRRGGDQVYTSLCREYDADLLFLGNLTIPFSMSDIESSYWPDLEMHLVNCDNQMSRRRSANHLVPKNGDLFIFQQAISRASENFLINSRGILR